MCRRARWGGWAACVGHWAPVPRGAGDGEGGSRAAKEVLGGRRSSRARLQEGVRGEAARRRLVHAQKSRGEKRQLDCERRLRCLTQRERTCGGGAGARAPQDNGLPSPAPPPPPPLCDIQSIGGFFTGPWTVTRLFFTARCSVDLLLKVRQAAVLTPPFLFLHRRRVVVVKTFRICTALTFAQPPNRGVVPVLQAPHPGPLCPSGLVYG